MMSFSQKKPKLPFAVRKKYARVSTRYPCNNFSVSFTHNGLSIVGIGYDVSDKGLSFSVPTDDVVLLRGQEVSVVFFTSTTKGEYTQRFTLKIASKRFDMFGYVIYGCAIPNADESFDFNRFSCLNNMVNSCDNQKYLAQQQQFQSKEIKIAPLARTDANKHDVTKKANDSSEANLVLTHIISVLEALEKDLAVNEVIQDVEAASVIKSTINYIKCLSINHVRREQ